MIAKFDKQIKILTSMCDNTGKLGIPNIFALFMDLATEHAPMINLGLDVLSPKGLFWLTTKTKIKINKRPQMLDEVNALTWPETPGKIRCNRFYTLKKEEETLVEGKSEWAIVEIETGKIIKLSDIYPENLEHCDRVICEEPYARVIENFENTEQIGTYTVKSTDIDVGQHMNNSIYSKVFLGAFTNTQLQEMNIKEMDISFKSPCYEGDELSIRLRKELNICELGLIRTDGICVATCRIEYCN